MSDRDYAMKAAGGAHNQAAHGEEEKMSDEEANSVADAAMEGAEENDEHAATEGEGKDEHAAAPAKSRLPSEVASHGLSPMETENGSAAGATKEVAKHEAAPKQEVAAAAHGNAEDERTPSSINHKASAAASMPKLQYTVQVASYPELKDAEAMALSLVKKGYPAFPFTVQINGQTWHRVSIGGYKTKQEAMTMQAEMAKAGIVKDSVVQKISR